MRPKFLLGLTATPERTDGGDLLALCQENLVYRCDLIEGARRDLLCRRPPGDDRNRLPEILRGWFGPDAGLPGTRHEVVLEQEEDGWQLRPSR